MADRARRDDRVTGYVDEITKLLHKIRDPARLSDVRGWLVKLAAGRGGHETDYLRLLEYALKSDAAALPEPFDGPPPDGPLSERLVGSDASRKTISLAAGGGGGGGGGSVHDEQLAQLLARTDVEANSVREFVAAARRLTCDGGELMDRAVRELLDDYGRAVRVASDDRADRLSEALAKEQAALMHRYRANAQRMLSRAQILQDHVRELVPGFQWDEYAADPDGYVGRAIRGAKRRRDDGRPGETAGDDDDDDDDEAESRDDDDDDRNGAVTRRKKAMATLDWLRSEVERADCETAELVERHDAAVLAIGTASKRKMAHECEARAQRLRAKKQLDGLRQQSARQVALIDGLVKTLSSDPDRDGDGDERC